MICPSFTEPLYFFYVSDLPVLIYYSYVPAIIAAFLIGALVLWSDWKSLSNRLLALVCFSFLVWTMSTLIDWTNIHSGVVLFTWSLLGPAAGFISISSIYFAYVFLDKKDVGVWLKMIFLVLLLPLVILAPSSYTLHGFNLMTCDAFGFEGLTNTIYFPFLGVLAMAWILALLIHRYRHAAVEFRKQVVLMGTGIELFLFSFFITEFLGQYLTTIGFLPDSQIETYGYFGMVAFMVYIGILIVRFRTFHVDLIAAQALVVALLILIASQFAFVRDLTNVALNGIALVVTAIIGFVLIRSVKREIEQREHIQKLAIELAETNQRQESLIHFVSHEVKGFLTKDMSAFAALDEGDLGPLPDAMKPFVKSALEQSRDGSRSVIDILQASNQKKGTVEYKKEPFDLAALVKQWFDKLKPLADKKSLAMTLDIDASGAPYTVIGDGPQTGDHVLRNLIENSINYTPSGSVAISVAKKEGKIVFSVKDTGVGITDEDKKRLFTEGGKGKDSLKVNAHSTGYGLFIAKNIVVAEGGSVRAESEGPGKGSTFIAEFPASATPAAPAGTSVPPPPPPATAGVIRF